MTSDGDFDKDLSKLEKAYYENARLRLQRMYLNRILHLLRFANQRTDNDAAYLMLWSEIDKIEEKNHNVSMSIDSLQNQIVLEARKKGLDNKEQAYWNYFYKFPREKKSQDG